jgi:hypothetical protein
MTMQQEAVAACDLDRGDQALAVSWGIPLRG